MLDFLLAVLPKTFGAIANWGRGSEMGAVKLADITSGSIMLENIMSIWALEWVVILFGCKVKGIYELGASESKNSLVGLCSL